MKDFFNFSPLPSFEWFIAGRMLNAFFVIGIFETTFTFLLEFVGGNKWSTVSWSTMKILNIWLYLGIFVYKATFIYLNRLLAWDLSTFGFLDGWPLQFGHTSSGDQTQITGLYLPRLFSKYEWKYHISWLLTSSGQ